MGVNRLSQTDIKKDDILWVADLRVLATIMVIALHVAAIPVLEYKQLLADGQIYKWHIGNIFNSISRFSVPVFVMLSGALLIPQEIGLFIFLKRRLKRIIFPFVFWSSVYTLLNLYLKMSHQVSIDFSIVLSTYGTDLLEGASVHLWYVYMIMALYLFIPIIAAWLRKATDTELFFFLMVWSLSVLVNQFNVFSLNPYLDPTYFGGYIGYLVLGYFLSERVRSTTFNLAIAIVCFFVGFLITVFGTSLSSKLSGDFCPNWYEFLSANVAIMSGGIFLIVKQLRVKFPGFKTIRAIVTKHGFGIYLVHVLVLHLLDLFGINYRFLNPVLAIPITTLLCMVISTFIIIIMAHLPLGKYISG